MSFDQNIFIDFRNGNIEPFYQKLYPALLIYAGKYLGDKGIYAEDCVQNAVLNAWRKRDDFESGYAFKAFLYVSIKNEIISIHRNVSAKERFLENQKLFDDKEYFIKSIIDNEAKILLFNHINSLPQKEREVCRLSYIEGLSNSEIAIKLNMSLATVKRHKSKSVSILRSQIKDLVLLISILPRLI